MVLLLPNAFGNRTVSGKVWLAVYLQTRPKTMPEQFLKESWCKNVSAKRYGNFI
jgi:hypothetical protein